MQRRSIRPFAASFPVLARLLGGSRICRTLGQRARRVGTKSIIGSKSAKEALDEIARKHEAIFEDAGYYD